MNKVREIFYSNMTIYSDTEEESLMIKSNPFMTFLNLDDRKDLLDKIDKGDTKSLELLDNYVVKAKVQQTQNDLANKIHNQMFKVNREHSLMRK